jgi:hypothetical protein
MKIKEEISMQGIIYIEYLDGKNKQVKYNDYFRALEEQRKILKTQKSKIKECKVVAIKEEV